MLFTPGQGLATIVIGLSILATEFIWAKKINEKLKDYIKKKGQDLKIFIKDRKNENN